MAEAYGFFDGDAEYGQEEFNQYFNAFLRSGVMVEDDGQMGMKVSRSSSTGNIAYQVAVGMAILRGFWFRNAQPTTLNLTSISSLSRYVRIVVRLSVTEKKVELAVKYGNRATNPVLPTLQRDSEVYEISLAKILQKPSSSATILTDERSDPTVCGAIRPRETTEYDTLLKQQQEQWNTWFESQQGAIGAQRQIDIQATQPEGQVAGRIWIKTY